MKKRKNKSLLNKNLIEKMKSDGIAKNIAIGATGIALASGVVAAGAALVNKKTRDNLGKTFERGMMFLQDISENPRERITATAHQITKGRGISKRKGRSRK